jgi:hypothetical protein
MMGFLISCEAKSITTASVVTETIDTVRVAMFKKGRCRKCSCSRAAHSRGTLTHYANLPLILFSLLNLEGQKIAGCNNCQKGETAGIYLETGNAIAVMSCGDNF